MINLNELTSHHPAFHNIVAFQLPPLFCGKPRKHQNILETTFAMRGNAKPFEKRLSPCAETPNLLRRDLRESRKGYKQKKHSEEMNLQSAL